MSTEVHKDVEWKKVPSQSNSVCYESPGRLYGLSIDYIGHVANAMLWDIRDEQNPKLVDEWSASFLSDHDCLVRANWIIRSL